MGEGRREFLRRVLMAIGAGVGFPKGGWAQEEPAQRVITCFYQFGKAALEALGRALPNGPRFLHIFSHSHPGIRPHPETANAVHALGPSFKYAMALDVHKYPGWQTASEEQLRAWALEFRRCALDEGGPADYFAFNEMPTTGAANPGVREQVARWVRILHDPGQGPKLRGIFYFTERNLNPQNWQGEADDFWAALEETCDLVVGEHYHSYEFAWGHTPSSLADHLFALPRWLEASGKPAQVSIARHKYVVIHSSFYGPGVRAWAGVNSEKHGLEDLERYFRHLIAATRRSPYGHWRIAFGPLATQDLDLRMLPLLAQVLAEEMAGL